MNNNISEMAVIGGILVSPSKASTAMELITSLDFWDIRHQNYFKAIEYLSNKNEPIDVITVCDWLQDNGIAPDLGHAMEIQKNTPSASNVYSYARAVKDAATERSMLKLCDDIAGTIHGDGRTDEKMEHINHLVSVLNQSSIGGIRDSFTIMKSAVEMWQQRSERGDKLIGYSTGFKELDNRTSGLQAPDLVVIAASSGRGKTTLAMNMVASVAVYQKKPTLVFSLEMSGEQIIDRMAASVGDIPLKLIKNGTLFANTEHDHKIMPVADKINKANLYIDDRGGLTIGQIQAGARKFFKEHGAGLLVVDYIGLVRGVGNTKEERTANVSGSLKALAKELNIPVIALAQTNRSATGRAEKRPVASDLRDSAAIEHDCDWLIMLHEDEINNAGVMEIITAKLRNGETGIDRLLKRLEFNKFQDMPAGYIEQENTVDKPFNY